MNSSFPIPQHGYAALSMLTQAADAMNPISNLPQLQPQAQTTPAQRLGRIQGTHVPLHVQSSDYNSESRLPVLSARTMETMSAFHGAGNGGHAYGNGGSYFNTNHANLGASGYGSASASGSGNGMGILDAESYDDGRGAVRDRMGREERTRGQREVVMSFGITDGPRLGTEKQKLAVDVGVETGGAKKKRKTKHKPVVDVQDDELEEEEEEEAGKKARGRPRVDTKDETPAEVSHCVSIQ